jgi:hypothetical protein
MPTFDLKLPYRRPQSLSDPFYDNTPEQLASLLAKADEELDWGDFQCLLGPFLPAGTYEESSYFLPLAFDYLLAHDDDSLDLVTSLVWFTSEYAPRLRHDGVLDAVREILRQCLTHWTADFVILHFDQNACREKGWGRQYFDYVPLQETVATATSDLFRFEAHADLAFQFFTDLASTRSDATRSAWFLEFVRTYKCKEVYSPPEHPRIRQLLEDQQLAITHAAIIRDSLPDYDPAHSYWRDTFAIVGATNDAL